MIVGLSGFAGSGKDTAAEVLTREYGFTRVAFADVLREMALAIDPYVELEAASSDYPIVLYHRLSRVIENSGWDHAKNEYPDVRRLLQRLGTEAGRNILGDNIWVDTALKNHKGHDIVVTDVRFPNELDAIHEQDGISIRIERPGVGPKNDHASETSLIDALFTHIINNDGTIEELHEKVVDVMDPYLEGYA